MINTALILLLAQTCAAEIDLQKAPDECYIMWEVNARLAKRRGVDLATQTLQYSAYWRSKSDTRLWIRELGLAAERPKSWPSERSWKREAPKWRAYCAAAADFVKQVIAGSYRARCRRAYGYGGIPDDGLHADDPAPCALAKRVICMPGELQAYWDTRYCSRARRNRRRIIPAKVAAGSPL